MEDLLSWLIRAKSRACMRVFISGSLGGRGMQEVSGGAVPCAFINQEIARLKAAASSHLEKEVALLPDATNRETR